GDVDPLNLIRDGSFEETIASAITPPGAYWTRTGSVNAMRVFSGGSDGGQQAWFYIGEPGGSISQVVATRTGQTYTLRYDFTGGAAANQLRVEAVGLTKSDLNQVVGVAGGTYQTRTLTFTASSEQTIIRFTDASPSPRPWYYFLDNVRLHEGLVVPPAPAGANDTLIGGADNDRLYGGGGDDLLRGGQGADWMDGGAGVDTADYSDSPGGETVNLNLATQISVNWASGDQLLRIENVTGTNFADSLIGDGGDNVLRGLSGADTLLGGSGADTLDGGAGADSMDGGAGNDTFIVDDVNDVVTESTNAGDDLVRTALAAYTLAANVENLTYTGASAFVGKGNELDNIITGGAGADTLEGGDGADTLLGLGGADILRGGAGIDLVDYSASVLGVTVDLGRAEAQVSLGDASGDVLSSIESVTGSATANNLLIGDAAANVLIGGAGSDLLRGGAGADRLQGGGGFDMADYGTSNAGDTVDREIVGVEGGAVGETQRRLRAQRREG
ncbi:MAG: hypothetical protein EBZ50_13465, partial [Alphaproteobacteria bacterium]|nr:hypothetical protein [Alphaproteobacteria bacterium]